MKALNKRLGRKLTQAFIRIKEDYIRYRVLIAVLIVFAAAAVLLFHRICIFTILCGYPCPGCGISRAFLSLVTLHWKEAFAMNPMIFIWVPLIACTAFNRYFMGRKTRHFTALFITAGLLSLVLYGVRMVFLYPDTAPMTYFEQNVFHVIKSWFQRWTL